MEEDGKGKIMVSLDTLRLEKKSEIIRLAEMRGCRNVRVFGSVVHGENRPDSDVDFLVDLEPGRSLFDLAGLMADLEDLLGAEVDLATTKGLHPYIRDRVLAEAQPL
jgi:predicted nucleotidyltransferase